MLLLAIFDYYKKNGYSMLFLAIVGYFILGYLWPL